MEHVRALLETKGSIVVSAFAPMGSEPDITGLIQDLLAMGTEQAAPDPSAQQDRRSQLDRPSQQDRHRVEILFPAASGGSEMEWISWDGASGFADSPGAGFGAEPSGRRLGPDALSRADLVIAPALAVDRSGTRLGHGGGYYDRALVHRRPKTPVVAVVHPEEVLGAGSLVREQHDVPVDAVLSTAGMEILTGSGDMLSPVETDRP